MSKMIRVMRHAEKVSKAYDHLPEFKVKQNMFLPAAIAAIDSGSRQPMEWTKHFDFIRGAGYQEAWENVPLRSNRVPESAPMVDTAPAEEKVKESVAPVPASVLEGLTNGFGKLTHNVERPLQQGYASPQTIA